MDIRKGDFVAWPTNLGWTMGPWLVYASLLNGASMALYNGSPNSSGFAKFVQVQKIDSWIHKISVRMTEIMDHFTIVFMYIILSKYQFQINWMHKVFYAWFAIPVKLFQLLIMNLNHLTWFAHMFVDSYEKWIVQAWNCPVCIVPMYIALQCLFLSLMVFYLHSLQSCSYL